MAEVTPNDEAAEKGEAGEDQPRAFRSQASMKSDELEEELEKETEDVIFKELHKKSADESLRSTLLYISLYEVLHNEARVLQLPDDTLYSAFVCMPMIARSAGYPLTMTAIALKMIFLTIFCILMQGGLILSLFHARVVLPGLDGVPSLCTYGQDTGGDRRPFGPAGQIYQRTYGNVETDYTMVIVRNTLYEVMKKAGVENDGVGPVEYGMESTTCRVVCAAVFCVAICGELFSMDTMARYLWYSPTLASLPGRFSYSAVDQDAAEYAGRWVEFDDSARDPKAKELFPMIGKSSLDHISFKCNGMTTGWKLCSALMLVIRCVIVLMTFWNGLSFLMNTGGIVDLILNSLALIFIIDLDRLMFSTLARGLSKDIMRRLEPLRVKPFPGDLQRQLKLSRTTETKWGCLSFLKTFISINISTLVLVAVTVGGHYAYFHQHCQMQISPLDMTQWFSPSYFMGQTRLFGGWEFVFGAWDSLPTKDKYSNNVTCMPAIHEVHSNNISKPVGCSLPEPWSVSVTPS